MKKMRTTSITIDDESAEWLDKQPKSFNLSKMVRDAIHKLMEKQEPEADEDDIDISGEDERY